MTIRPQVWLAGIIGGVAYAVVGVYFIGLHSAQAAIGLAHVGVGLYAVTHTARGLLRRV